MNPTDILPFELLMICRLKFLGYINLGVLTFGFQAFRLTRLELQAGNRIGIPGRT